MASRQASHGPEDGFSIPHTGEAGLGATRGGFGKPVKRRRESRAPALGTEGHDRPRVPDGLGRDVTLTSGGGMPARALRWLATVAACVLPNE